MCTSATSPKDFIAASVWRTWARQAAATMRLLALVREITFLLPDERRISQPNARYAIVYYGT